jgi:hypothetical protein
MYRFLRWGNLLWIIYSMLLIEFSLNFNHVSAVLGGPNDNEIHLPGQLLPLMIGGFGFVRICWILFEEWRAPGNTDPSVADANGDQPKRARTLHMSNALHMFSPSMDRTLVPKPQHSGDELDELERYQSPKTRYLVAYLPWLSLLECFRNEPKVTAKRVSATSGQSDFTEMDDKERWEQRGSGNETILGHPNTV